MLPECTDLLIKGGLIGCAITLLCVVIVAWWHYTKEERHKRRLRRRFERMSDALRSEQKISLAGLVGLAVDARTRLTKFEYVRERDKAKFEHLTTQIEYLKERISHLEMDLTKVENGNKTKPAQKRVGRGAKKRG